MDSCGHFIIGDELIEESICRCLGRLIPGWTCYGVLRVVVGDVLHVSNSSGWFQPQEIYAD